MQAQSGIGHDPDLTLSYTPTNIAYTTATKMRQDRGYLGLAKNTINNNVAAGADLFFNFTFDTTGKNMYVAYTTDGTTPNTSSTNVSATFSNFSDPNRTWVATLPSQVSGTTVKYVFYASDGAIGDSWGRISAAGYTNNLGDAYTAYEYTVRATNEAGGGNWSDTSTWVAGVVPNSETLSVEITGTSAINLDQNADVENLSIVNGATLSLNTSFGLDVNQDLNNDGTLTVNSASSLIVRGNSTGGITYNRNLLTDNWYLVSSPVANETIEDLIANHTFATGTAPNIGLAPYDNSQANSNDSWDYQTSISTGTLGLGTGYSVKLASAGNISFSGLVPTDFVDVGVTSNAAGGPGNGVGNAFNLLGNPYPSYISINTNANATTDNFFAINAGDLTEDTIWLWNQDTNSYDIVNQTTSAYYLAPGQGFFVESSGNNIVRFTEGMQSHQTDVFQKSSDNRTKIKLLASNSSLTNDADIFYIDGTTEGFDNGYDSSIFTGVNVTFAIYTETVENSNGKKLGIQSLPNSNLETTVIPIGLIANAGEITFTAESLNLPEGLKVFLEDRENSSFTELTTATNYKVTLDSAVKGSGRFFLHTKSSALSTDDISLTGVGIYAVNKNTLRISGINSSDASVKVYNILGRKVVDENFSSKSVYDVSLPNLNTGVYIVQLSTEKGKISKKIVLE